MEAQCFLLLYSPGDWGPSTEMQNEQQLPVSLEFTGGIGHMLTLVAVGGLVLLADLLELSLDDLDNLGIVQVGLGNADMQ